MPRNMSFALTTKQILSKSKTVTRRFGWWFLKVGDELWAVEKSMGLKKGDKIKRLAKIRVVSVRREPLSAITDKDCALEGFPHLSPEAFIDMLHELNYGGKLSRDRDVNRIEFEYI